MFFLLIFIIMLPSSTFCSIQHATGFFEQQLQRAIANDEDIKHFLGNSENLIKRSAHHFKSIYPKSYRSDKPITVHDFTSVNQYNLLAIGTILLAADSVKEECPGIFNFLETNGLCGKNCGGLKEVFIMRNTAFEFNKKNKKFMPKVGKFVQLFLYNSCWPQTPFDDLLSQNKDYQDKLFDIVAQYYVDENDIKVLKSEYKKLGLLDGYRDRKEGPEFKFLIDKYDAFHADDQNGPIIPKTRIIPKNSNDIREELNELKNEITKNLEECEMGKRIDGVIKDKEQAKRYLEEFKKEKPSLSSYIPYLIGGTILVSFLYFFVMKKQPSKNSNQVP